MKVGPKLLQSVARRSSYTSAAYERSSGTAQPLERATVYRPTCLSSTLTSRSSILDLCAFRFSIFFRAERGIFWRAVMGGLVVATIISSASRP
jgi:hypothetical protein